MADHEVSDRGFKHYAPVLTDYGHTVRVYESSSAMQPKIWMRVEKGEERFPGDLPAVDAPVHMTVEQAEQIRDNLDAAIKQHYQN